jgi:hypothetical protein
MRRISGTDVRPGQEIISFRLGIAINSIHDLRLAKVKPYYDGIVRNEHGFYITWLRHSG